jgi:hypothetical protein
VAVLRHCYKLILSTDMGKGKEKDEGDGTTRERTILWDENQTKFMLGWFIDYMKGPQDA